MRRRARGEPGHVGDPLVDGTQMGPQISGPALERIEGGRIPDLVATDFMMPLMNGGELIERLRRNPATEAIPIILISSSPGSEQRTSADAFFRKPFDPSVLTACVLELLRKGT